MLVHVLVHHGDRPFNQNVGAGDLHRLRPFARLAGQDGFVFVVEQHIPLAALHEGVGGFAGILGQHIHILIDRGDEVFCFILTATGLGHRSPKGCEVPAGPAGGLGISGDHIHIVVVEIIPALDFFGVSGPHEQDHGGIGDDRLVGEFPLPADVHQAFLLQLVNVCRQGQAHHIGLQAIDHGAGLAAGAAVAGLHANRCAGLFLVVGHEQRDDPVVGPLGHGVAHEQDLVAVGPSRLGHQQAGAGEGEGGGDRGGGQPGQG